MNWLMTSYFENFKALTDSCNKVIVELDKVIDHINKILKVKELKNPQKSPHDLTEVLSQFASTKTQLNSLLQDVFNSSKEVKELNNYKQKLFKIIDEILAIKFSHETIFLTAVKKNFQNLQLEIQKQLAEELPVKSSGSAMKAEEILQNSYLKFEHGFIQVYILLYQHEGTKIANWEHAIRAISKHNVNRPTYREEKNVQEVVRAKTDPERYGYAIVNIKEDDILPQETKKFDIFNRELLVLKENAVKNFSIVGFVHANKKCYRFENNILTYYGDLA